ncbi:hypothetical protein [Haloarcula amylolytica]|jgi:hypothetical protein|uniref:hypothetical protein n=1 Tax=Haloarcula amylolytica TaxID=396317 RepID=UPI003C72F48B
MTGSISPEALATRRWWVYGGGLVAIVGLRTALSSSGLRAFGAALVLGVMALTYASELWLAADGRVASPGLLLAGFAGVVAGLWLTLTGTLAGLLFAAGGLLFCNRAMAATGGDRS